MAKERERERHSRSSRHERATCGASLEMPIGERMAKKGATTDGARKKRPPMLNGYACTCDVDSKMYKDEGCYCGVAEMEAPAIVHANGYACSCDVDSQMYKDEGCYCGVADMEAPRQPAREPPVARCYNCGEPGHNSAACSKPRTHNKFKGHSADRSANKVCRRCHQKGHLSFQCTLAGIKKVSKAPRDWLPGKQGQA